jgi:hypothetical protein
MPIARFEMPDGRVARFEVPAGLSPEDAQNLISSSFVDHIYVSYMVNDNDEVQFDLTFNDNIVSQ